MAQYDLIEGAELLRAQRTFSLPAAPGMKEFTMGTVQVPTLENTGMIVGEDESILESVILYTDLQDESGARQYLASLSDEGLRRTYAVLMKAAGSSMVELVKREMRKK